VPGTLKLNVNSRVLHANAMSIVAIISWPGAYSGIREGLW